MTAETVLIVDDDATFSAVLARALTRRGYQTHCAATPAKALAAAQQLKPEKVVLDLNLDGESGIDLIAGLKAAAPACRIVVLTGFASIATAVEAIKRGASHYLAKPADSEAIVAALLGDVALPAEPLQTLSVERLEWEHIQRVFLDHQGNVSATARALNMHRRTLQRKLAKRPVQR
jgi:two-component system, response regulator RegA